MTSSSSAAQHGLWPPLALQPSAVWLWPPLALQPSAVWLWPPLALQPSAVWLWPPVALQPSAGYGLLVHEVSLSHTTTRHSQYHSSGLVISS
jgi:hypothetical protein